MYELLNLLMYLGGGLAAMLFTGFFFYYAGRLIGLGVMRSIHDVQNNRFGRRAG
jgi:hypothetical protein